MRARAGDVFAGHLAAQMGRQAAVGAQLTGRVVGAAADCAASGALRFMGGAYVGARQVLTGAHGMPGPVAAAPTATPVIDFVARPSFLPVEAPAAVPALQGDEVESLQ